MIKGKQHTNHKTITTHQQDNATFPPFIILYNTCTASLPTAKPCATMLTGQGLLPLAPSIQAQKMTTKRKKWQGKPEYKYTINKQINKNQKPISSPSI